MPCLPLTTTPQEAAAEHHGRAVVDGVTAVRRVRYGSKFESPLAVPHDVCELLGLRVGQRQDRRERLVRAGAELALNGAGRRRLEDEQVAQHDLGQLHRIADLEGADEVDVVPVLERAHEQLVLVARELESAEASLELGLDALLAERMESVERDLLALVDLLRRHELVDLLGLRDRTGDDAPLRDLHRLQQVAVADLGARGADGDVARSDPDRYEVLALLDALLVVRDVENRQQCGKHGEHHCDPDVPKSITHVTALSPSLFRYSTSSTL